GQPQATAEHGLDIALRFRFRARVVHEAFYALEALEVFFNIALRRAALDTEIARQAESAHAVDQAEVDHLRIAALLARHFRRRDGEDFRRGRAMYVLAFGESLQHAGVLGEMRHDAQLDLRVIGRHDHAARRRDKGFADASPFGRADRNVL